MVREKVTKEHANFILKKSKKFKGNTEPVSNFDIIIDKYDTFNIEEFLNNNDYLSKFSIQKMNYDEFDIDIEEHEELSIDDIVHKSFKNDENYNLYIDISDNVFSNKVKLTKNNPMTLKRLFRVISYSIRDTLMNMKQGKLPFEPINRLGSLRIEYIGVELNTKTIMVRLTNFYLNDVTILESM